jgi:CspA family cold shock protein
VWHSEQGWGVIDSPETPGGCWVHFSHLWNDGIPEAGPGEVVEVSGGYREVFEGETVDFEWEHAGQDGYAYRATTVQARGRPAPHRVIRHDKAGEHPDPSRGFEFRIDGGSPQEEHRGEDEASPH